MQDEMNSLYENGTRILVEKPEDKRVTNSRWVFTRKNNLDGSGCYKARLVIKGYSQEGGIDYKETFSPVKRFDTVRLMLSIAVHENLHLGQYDIKTTFLHGNLREDIYIKQPKGFDGVYVDDGLIAATNQRLIDGLLNNLSKQFTITITKNVKNFLGIEICRLKDGSIFIHRSKYIRRLLEIFNISEANSVTTPIECNYDNYVSE